MAGSELFHIKTKIRGREWGVTLTTLLKWKFISNSQASGNKFAIPLQMKSRNTHAHTHTQLIRQQYNYPIVAARTRTIKGVQEKCREPFL